TKAARQPCASAIHPAIGKNTIDEIAKAVPNIDSASGRRSARYRSAIIELDGATPHASPAPIRKRASANCQMLATSPVSAVMALQNRNPAAMMLRRLQRSAAHAIGTPSRE